MKKQSVYAAVIGGGAAGLMCAVQAAKRYPDKRIAVIEKADRVGKKLLVTGNGRCNLSNLNASSADYHGEGSEQLINILFEKYPPEAVLKSFKALGLFSRSDSEGRVYPLSNQASSVLDILRLNIKELGVEELCGFDIRDIVKTSSGFEITSTDRKVFAQKLVVATGGRADHAGRESGSADILRMLGLSTVKPTPSLSPVKVRCELLRSLKGVRADARVTLMKGGKALKAERGEVQFAEEALSGICVFNLSREANKGGCELSLDLLPDYNTDDVRAEITRRVKSRPYAPAGELFTGVFHKNLGLFILKSSGIKPSALCSDISDKEISALCKRVKDRRFTCEENHDFRKAQVTAGGIKLSEIDPKTFEARRIKDLYIVGEALDIDGDCGGYNLQFAFASGMCAGECL